MNAEIVITNSSRLSGRGRSRCRFLLVWVLRSALRFAERLSPAAGAQTSEDCIKSDADLLFKIARQIAA